MPGAPDIGSVWTRKAASHVTGIDNRVTMVEDAHFLSLNEPGVVIREIADGLLLSYTLSAFYILFDPISVSKAREMNSYV